MQSPFNLFSNIADDRLKIFKDGDPQYSRIKELFSLTDAEFAKGTKLSLHSLKSGQAKLPKDFLKILVELGNAINIVDKRLKDEKKVTLWLQLKNPQLGNVSPRDMVKYGRFKKLVQLVHNANEGYHE